MLAPLQQNFLDPRMHIELLIDLTGKLSFVIGQKIKPDCLPYTAATI